MSPFTASIIAFSTLALIILLCRTDIRRLIPFRSPATANSARLCCLILTSPNNLFTRARAINATWGPRCDRYFFISEHLPKNTTFAAKQFARQVPIAPIDNILPGYAHLTLKTTLAFLFAYSNLSDECDWFVKADDDTYLIVEHLRDFLQRQDTSQPVTFGYNFKAYVPRGYHSGGAAYVLSREALRRFHRAHQDPYSRCAKDSGSEDTVIAQCLRHQGVVPERSLDEHNRERFHPLPFADHFLGRFPDWLHRIAENPQQTHYNCCSERSVSFHYVQPEGQYLMDFLFLSTKNSKER